MPTGEYTMTPLSKMKQIAAYFPEWGVGNHYFVKNIVTSGSAEKITIINYAFGLPDINENGDVVCRVDNPSEAYERLYDTNNSVDGQADTPGQPLRGHYNQLKKLKERYSHIQVIISLGGWTGSGWFSDAARTSRSRERFVASCVDMYMRGNLPITDSGAGGPGAAAGVFDGIDIDWEYPVSGGLSTNHYHADDAKNFVLLLQEFRKQFADAGQPDFLLTMAGPGPGQAGQYNLHEAHPYLDLVAIMAYDLRGACNSETGHHTNLCSSRFDPNPAEQRVSADRSVRMYRDEYGVPAEKILLGSAFYGKAWKNVRPENNGLFQPGEGITEQGSDYRDLLSRLERGFIRYWDDSAQAPWLYSASEQIFWTYDDPESLRLKAQYARFHGLGGLMFWEISGDDDAGTLVDAIATVLRGTGALRDPCKE